ncbi:MAG TPA: DUF6448 family protein [bacterium]|nr:DUF6448 family protein [bacterium]
MKRVIIAIVTLVGAVLCSAPVRVYAYCDTYDGPVVKEAQAALENGDVTPVLKWVSLEAEPEVQDAFNKALGVRGISPQTKEVADRYFFETVVRLHRAAQKAPYTGIKPPGTPIDPAVREADNALERGNADNLVRQVSDQAALGIKNRFADAFEKRAKRNMSVEAGREYVKSYIELIHYIEGLVQAAKGQQKKHDLIDTEV